MITNAHRLTLRLCARSCRGNVRSFSGEAKQTQAPLSTLEAPLKQIKQIKQLMLLLLLMVQVL